MIIAEKNRVLRNITEVNLIFGVKGGGEGRRKEVFFQRDARIWNSSDDSKTPRKSVNENEVDIMHEDTWLFHLSKAAEARIAKVKLCVA